MELRFVEASEFRQQPIAVDLQRSSGMRPTQPRRLMHQTAVQSRPWSPCLSSLLSSRSLRSLFRPKLQCPRSLVDSLIDSFPVASKSVVWGSKRLEGARNHIGRPMCLVSAICKRNSPIFNGG